MPPVSRHPAHRQPTAPGPPLTCTTAGSGTPGHLRARDDRCTPGAPIAVAPCVAPGAPSFPAGPDSQNCRASLSARVSLLHSLSLAHSLAKHLSAVAFIRLNNTTTIARSGHSSFVPSPHQSPALCGMALVEASTRMMQSAPTSAMPAVVDRRAYCARAAPHTQENITGAAGAPFRLI